MTQEIADKLKMLRKKNGLSQEELAEKLGVSRQAVSKWERSEASPDTENLIMIANIYGISLDHLFGINAENTVTQILSDSTDHMEKKRGVVSLRKDDDSADSIRMTYPENSLREEIYPQSIPEPDAVQSQPEPGMAGSNNNSIPYQDNSYSFSQTQYTSCGNMNYMQNVNYQDNDDFGMDEELHKSLLKFPFPCAALILFFIAGGLFNLWHPAWMVSLLIPMYYTTIEAVYKKDLNIFCYPVFITIIYLLAGFYLNLWHPGWLLFPTIPLYYWFINTYLPKPKKRKNKKKNNGQNSY